MTHESRGRAIVWLVLATALVSGPFASSGAADGSTWAQTGRQDVTDTDGDRIPDDQDRCPRTPARAVPLADGCAAFQIAANPELIGAPVESAIQTALDGLEARDPRGIALFGPAADPVRMDLGEAQQQLAAGLGAIAQGDVCAGAAMVRRLRDLVEAASRGMGDVVLSEREALQSGVSPNDPDADAAEVQFHELGYRGGLVGRAMIAARSLDEAVQAVCDEVADEHAIEGFIETTDEAAGVVRLRNGKELALADLPDLGPVYEGAHVRIEGVRLKDGTGILKRVTQLGNEQFDLSLIPNFPLQCMRLNIAPFQPFYPPLVIAGPYVLHEPAAYRVRDVLLLESPMRLAARSGGCATAPDLDGGKVKSFRYSLKLEYQKSGEPGFTLIASDLVPADDPVGLPASALPSASSPAPTGTLRVTEQAQACIGVLPKAFCSSTVKVLSVQDFAVEVRPRGSLAFVGYATTLFDLEDWDTSGFRVALVTSMAVHQALQGVPISFVGEGFSASGAATTETISSPGNPFFAIYQEDFLDQPGLLFPLATHGTVQRSGLRWPRAVGQRNGHTFWYSATLPFVIRDLIDLCNPPPSSFYRLPWKNGVQIGVGQGNNSAFSHTGSQAFAFDVSLGTGQIIRAIRGGTVEWLQESQTTNFDSGQPIGPGNQPFPNGSLQNWGNAVRIAHQDGTFAWYFHIQTNGVLVSQGQQVQRGQPIAEADNTGRSTGAHLHFQVQADNNNWGQSIQIRFDTGNLGQCYIPQTSDSLISNNANPNYPNDP